MRIAVVLATLTGMAAAEAQTSTYYAERGRWTIMSGPKYCRALNRPADDFNFAPFAALQIAIDGKGEIGVDVFFWPGAVTPSESYELILDFPSRKDPIALSAHPILGDYMLTSVTDMALWRALQDARYVDARVTGKANLDLRFGLDDIGWVLNALTTCQRVLPNG